MTNVAAKFEDLSPERLEELDIIVFPVLQDPDGNEFRDEFADYVFTQDQFVHKDRIRVPPGTNAVIIIPEIVDEA